VVSGFARSVADSASGSRRANAFVVPSARRTIRFDLGEVHVTPHSARRGWGRRVRIGIGASVALALAALLTMAASQRSGRPAAAAAVTPTSVTPPIVGEPITSIYARAAATCPGLAPAVLEAIHDVETKRAMVSGPSPAGARGPMQFLPDTWSAYGIDADADGRADVESLVDAVFGAAHLLCANGGGDPATLPFAVWNYNHSWGYVAQVLAATQVT
jgi:hypothetical protein